MFDAKVTRCSNVCRNRHEVSRHSGLVAGSNEPVARGSRIGEGFERAEGLRGHDEERGRGVESSERAGKMRGVYVRDEANIGSSLGEIGERIDHHSRTKIRAADAQVDDRFNCSAVVACPCARMNAKGIISNISTIRCERNFDAILNQESKYTINFYNPIFTQGPGSPSNLSSTGFNISGRLQTLYLDDDGNGNIRSYYLEEGSSTKVYVNNTQGAIDYGTGKLIIDQLNITGTVLDNNSVEVFVTLNSNDIVSVRNVLLTINTEDITVNTIVDKIATGESSAGVDYQTTSSSELSRTGGTGVAGAASRTPRSRTIGAALC